MKQKIRDEQPTETYGGITPMTVPEDLIARLAGKCEAIFPLQNRAEELEPAITDEELAQMEQWLRKFTPAPVRVLFREECCAMMCAESEAAMERTLKTLRPTPMPEFTVARLASAMEENAGQACARNAGVKKKNGGVFYSFISVAAVLALMLGLMHVWNLSHEAGQDMQTNDEDVSDKASDLKDAEKKELYKPTIFELQGGDERVPVLAPPAIRPFLPNIEY